MVSSEFLVIYETFRPLHFMCAMFGVCWCFFQSRVRRALNLIHSLLMFSAFIVSIFYHIGYVTPLFSSQNSIAYSVLATQQLLEASVIATIYYQVIFHKPQMAKIVETMTLIDTDFAQMKIDVKSDSFRWQIMSEVISLVVAIHLTFLGFCFAFEVDSMLKTTLELFSVFYPFLVIESVLLFFINITKFIRDKFKKIQYVLRDLFDISRRHFDDEHDQMKMFHIKTEHFFSEIKFVASIYDQLFQTVNCLNQMFGLSNLMTMSLLGITLTCHLFLLLKMLMENIGQFESIRMEIFG